MFWTFFSHLPNIQYSTHDYFLYILIQNLISTLRVFQALSAEKVCANIGATFVGVAKVVGCFCVFFAILRKTR